MLQTLHTRRGAKQIQKQQKVKQDHKVLIKLA